jgi:hypothetical protein
MSVVSPRVREDSVRPRRLIGRTHPARRASFDLSAARGSRRALNFR